MDVILKQLGELVLDSVPTVVLFILLVIAYRYLVHGPLKEILAERRERTIGAIEKAQAAIASAEAKTLEYETTLRAARAAIFHAREQRLLQWQAERDAAVAAARSVAQERVQVARQQIEQSVAEARLQVESATDQLAAQVLKAVLPPAVTSTESAR
ncbi:MAG: F0F1 ATP synthase subunit B family protein [Acidobacteriaceae bacterium]